jgi:hypothetical protein
MRISRATQDARGEKENPAEARAAFGHHEDRAPTHGYAATREAGEAARWSRTGSAPTMAAKTASAIARARLRFDKASSRGASTTTTARQPDSGAMRELSLLRRGERQHLAAGGRTYAVPPTGVLLEALRVALSPTSSRSCALARVGRAEHPEPPGAGKSETGGSPDCLADLIGPFTDDCLKYRDVLVVRIASAAAPDRRFPVEPGLRPAARMTGTVCRRAGRCRAQSRACGFGEAVTSAEAEGRAHVAAGDLGRAGHPRLPERERPPMRHRVCQIDVGLGSAAPLFSSLTKHRPGWSEALD